MPLVKQEKFLRPKQDCRLHISRGPQGLTAPIQNGNCKNTLSHCLPKRSRRNHFVSSLRQHTDDRENKLVIFPKIEKKTLNYETDISSASPASPLHGLNVWQPRISSYRHPRAPERPLLSHNAVALQSSVVKESRTQGRSLPPFYSLISLLSVRLLSIDVKVHNLLVAFNYPQQQVKHVFLKNVPEIPCLTASLFI